MVQQSTTGRSLSWSETWVNALTKPSEETYAEIANDPAASGTTASIWMFISALIGNLTVFLLIGAGGGGIFNGIVFAIFTLVAFWVIIAVSQTIAKALSGTGTYTQLAYAVAAYAAPLSLVSTIISVIPGINILVWLIGLYGLVLNVTAVKAVNKFGWGPAIISSAVIIIALLCLAGVVSTVVLALLGPAIGNIFSNITQGI
jgi:hypothetical protein